MDVLERLEGAMLVDTSMVVPECKVTNHFSPGVYIREVMMPKDSIVIGHEHRTNHMNIVSQGSLILLDLDTEEKTLIEAPCTFESKAGTRKVGYILEDCVWSNIHITDETDLGILEDTLIKKSSTFKLHNKKEIGG